MSQQEPYTRQRAIPQAPYCGQTAVSVQNDGKLLLLRGPRRQFSWSAVSVKPDSLGTFDYSCRRATDACASPKCGDCCDERGGVDQRQPARRSLWRGAASS